MQPSVVLFCMHQKDQKLEVQSGVRRLDTVCFILYIHVITCIAGKCREIELNFVTSAFKKYDSSLPNLLEIQRR